MAAAALVVLLLPGTRSGASLLRRWGVDDAGPEQIREAVGHLRQRRVLYVVVYVVLFPVVAAVDAMGNSLGGLTLALVPLLVALAVAELIATLRPVSGLRVASLDRREWRLLVPRWALLVAAGQVGLVLVLIVVGIATAPPEGHTPVPTASGSVVHVPYSAEPGWLGLASAALCLAVTAAAVHLAVRRPTHSDEVVDRALRTRSARVAVGIGLTWLGASVGIAAGGVHDPDLFLTGWLGGVVAELVAIGCWIRLAVPTRTAPVPVAG